MRRFTNPGLNPAKPTPYEVCKFLLTRRHRPWPKWTDYPKKAPPPLRVPAIARETRMTYVSHSTCLIQTGGLNVITDPVFGHRIGPFGILGHRRHHDPGVSFEDLPDIDLCLLSHDHFDHLELPSVKRIAAQKRGGGDHQRRLTVCTGLGVKRRLPNFPSLKVHEMDWSGRYLIDKNTTLWGSFLIKTPDHVVFFAGDTGYNQKHFFAIRDRLKSVGRVIDLALLPIGCFSPEWFQRDFHMSPDDAVAAHRDLGALKSVSIHFETFQLAEESPREATDRLVDAKKRRGLQLHEFVTLSPGDHVVLKSL
uniref:Metallo-beta-lactamase domain-containing protein n=1 Tax=Chromera velia CCMP2878 TaxID=1169474 RepID=A0A0G4I6C1_9ALVE|eukprot:Cvel_11369.t1-p1 / transcript=Cvel_11369.t1 / gene=Cvel_11369 / organism=Chromera_velia_CCMP2878 / gene_product=N-acyl-phosphatidylethanolamine-hydrolyzing, putative / transcript_product=N-acyl-phosphatidylethanolamine-hydrolyzing, putative / location=Cvel_scaffold712:63900-66179(+) / protein_length=307 / sequence_SO=supercontig / SO=protein_coding / is_pseudo=false